VSGTLLAGGTDGAANSFSVSFATSTLTASVRDSANTEVTPGFTPSPTLTASTEHTVEVVILGAMVGLYLDGALVNTASGLGSYVQPTTVYAGTRSAAGSEFNGFIKGFKVVKGASALKAVP
jgi:hypothetical protein